MRRLLCERCGAQMRQVLDLPLGPIIQDWHKNRSVSELDPDMCDQCEVEFVAACRGLTKHQEE